MHGRRSGVVFLAVLAALLLAAPMAPAGGKSKRAQQKAIAAKIVGEIAGVKDADLVVISGSDKDFDLIEDLVLEALKKGASPLQFVGRETFGPRYYAEVPAERDGDSRDFVQKLADFATVDINIGRGGDPALYKKVPAERLSKKNEASAPIEKVLNTRGVRRVYLGNGLYPTKTTAKQYGMTEKQLEKLFWDSLDVDYGKLAETGAKLQGILEGGKQIHVTHKNGTDLTFGIEKRLVTVSNGIITDEDVAKGGAATMEYLPAGEVILTPQPGTAEGKLVFDRLPYSDGEIRKLVMTFKAGKLESLEAAKTPAYTRFREFYDKAPAGKDAFAFVDFGINPRAKIPKGSKLLTWITPGMISLGIGSNHTFGGEIDIPYGEAGFLPGATVKVDDQVVVENGQLKL